MNSAQHIPNSAPRVHTSPRISTMSTPQGVQITASKVHVPFKTELINEIASERFAGRAPHLVGILATDKEDARTYAEVGACSGTLPHGRWSARTVFGCERY